MIPVFISLTIFYIVVVDPFESAIRLNADL